MRMGGAYPFGQGSVPVQLASGGQFYPPSGNYLIQLGEQTVLQWFDPLLLSWRSIGSSDTSPVFISTDGYNYRLVNASGVVVGNSITNAGSGAVNGIGAAATGVAVSYGAAPANGQAAAAYAVVGGLVSSIAITNGGSGFTVPPTIFIDPPPAGGIQAVARCTISAGIINAITIDNQGAGYTSVPNVYVVPQFATYPGIGVPVNPAGAPSIVPPGLLGSQQPPFLPGINWERAASGGAVLTAGALTGSGTLTGIVMTAYGAGYTGTTIPTVTITGAGAAAATALMSMCVTSITITAGGAAYAGTQVLLSDLGFLTASTGENNNMPVVPRPMMGRATQSGGVINATVIEDEGFGLQIVPVIGIIQTNTTPATTIATLTAVCGGISDTSILQPAVQ